MQGAADVIAGGTPLIHLNMAYFVHQQELTSVLQTFWEIETWIRDKKRETKTRRRVSNQNNLKTQCSSKKEDMKSPCRGNQMLQNCQTAMTWQ